MRRITALLRILPGRADAARDFFHQNRAALGAWAQAGALDNVSAWRVSDQLFLYAESDAPKADWWAWRSDVTRFAEVIAMPGMMEQVYENIGFVRADKSIVKHRVFALVLRPGRLAEYKDNHRRLELSREGVPDPGPESNFTIWSAGRNIWGYCELDKTMLHELTDEEKAEARKNHRPDPNPICDWLTDDFDYATGDVHEHVERLY